MIEYIKRNFLKNNKVVHPEIIAQRWLDEDAARYGNSLDDKIRAISSLIRDCIAGKSESYVSAFKERLENNLNHFHGQRFKVEITLPGTKTASSVRV